MMLFMRRVLHADLLGEIAARGRRKVGYAQRRQRSGRLSLFRALAQLRIVEPLVVEIGIAAIDTARATGDRTERLPRLVRVPLTPTVFEPASSVSLPSVIEVWRLTR